MTDKIPIIGEITAINSAEVTNCLAEEAGIINIEVISKIPIILIDEATTIVSKNRKSNCIRKTLTPSALAKSSLIVISKKDDQK